MTEEQNEQAFKYLYRSKKEEELKELKGKR